MNNFTVRRVANGWVLNTGGHSVRSGEEHGFDTLEAMFEFIRQKETARVTAETAT